MSYTVKDVLDRLAAGEITLDEAAADFRTRSWPARKKSNEAQRYGAADNDDAGVTGWDALDADSRLTTSQYQTLAEAASNAGH